MKYNQKLAEQLAKKYRFKPSTIRNWKYLDRIPDRYADPKYKLPKPANGVQLQGLDKLLKINYITRKKIKGVKPHRFIDYQRAGKEATISKQEIKAMAATLKELKKHIKKFISKPKLANLQAILNLPYIKKRSLIAHQKLYERVVYPSYQFLPEDRDYLLARFKVVLEEIDLF